MAWGLVAMFAMGYMLPHGFVRPAMAQQVGSNSKPLIDSPERYQRRLKNLIRDRVAALIPTGDFVVGVTVEVSRPPLPGQGGSQPGMELPGFRAGNEPQATVLSDKYSVDHVTVRVVSNTLIGADDQKYIRDLVPILADQDPGDVTLEMIQSRQAPPPGQEQPAVAGETFPPTVPEEPEERFYGLTVLQWIMLGFAALLVLVFLWGLMRMVSAWTRPKPLPPPPLPPPPKPDAFAEKNKEIEEETKKLAAEQEMGNLRHAVIRTMFTRPEVARTLVNAWRSEGQKFNNLMHALGPSLSRQAILPCMGREEYVQIERAQLSNAKVPDEAAKMNALQDARSFLMAEELANPEILRPNPFAFLDKLTWGQIAYLIKEEPMRVKAMVLSRTPAEMTARIMETLPKEVQLEIAVNIGNLKDLPLEMAESVAVDLAEKARHVPDARMVEVEGPRALVDLMGRTSSDTSRYLLTALKSKDRELSEEVEKRFFMFEALPLVPSDLVPQAVRTMPSSVVITAIQGADPEIQRKVIMAFPESARPGLATALRASHADPEAVEDARRQVVYKFQQLGEQGKINLKQISDAWQSRSAAS